MKMFATKSIYKQTLGCLGIYSDGGVVGAGCGVVETDRNRRQHPFVVIFVQGGDPVIYPDPDASIPQPSVVYDNIYEAAKNNGHEYDWWMVM